jgi:biopolymer transport protein ExbB/TolQ
MKNTMFLSLLVLITVSLSFGRTAKEEQAAQQAKLEELRKEISALQSIRLEKAETLEKIEAARWEKRYKQNVLTKEHQDKARDLESRYSRRAADLSRINDELVSSRTATRELEDRNEEYNNRRTGLLIQYKQAIEEDATGLSQDIPLQIEDRTLLLAKANELISFESPQIEGALDAYFAERRDRLAITTQQKVYARNSIVGTTPDVPVTRMQLGSVFAAEQERDAARTTQALFRTGSLQGKTFEWRSDLSPEFSQWIGEAVTAGGAGKSWISVPIDVLQNSKARSFATDTEESSFKENVSKWFNTGGLVMYPMLLVAFLALFFAMEKQIAFARRGHYKESFIKELHSLVSQNHFEKAMALCKQQSGIMAKALYAVVSQGSHDRSSAEKGLKEVLLREIPGLERRLSLIGALGSSAPLLGLLGTVSGMITLFKVITEMGTNDARILAGGISEALVTTQTGLIIAVPILLIHGYLAERMDKITSDINTESMGLLNRIWPNS